MAKTKVSLFPCIVEGCERRDVVGNKMCAMHYQRARAGKPLIKPEREIAAKVAPTLLPCGAARHCPAAKKLDKAGFIKLRAFPCAVEGCNRRDLIADKYCSLHEQRRRAGLPLGGPGRLKAKKGAPPVSHCGARQCPGAAKLWRHIDKTNDPDKYAAPKRERYAARKGEYSVYSAAYYRANADAVKDRVKAWKEANPERRRATNARNLAKYREYIRQATPPWADQAAIDAIYRRCPKDWHVDHIIPLRGKLVCGLNVAENLQYLPAAENCSKGNRFDPESLTITEPQQKMLL